MCEQQVVVWDELLPKMVSFNTGAASRFIPTSSSPYSYHIR